MERIDSPEQSEGKHSGGCVANLQSHHLSISSCSLCPRCCGVDRTAGEKGYCGAGNTAEIYSYGPHSGEEPPISAQNGSGTVFFSRCTLRCLYCQNYPCSQEGEGDEYDSRKLAGIFRTLHKKECHNWNLVSPTPWLPQITEALELLKTEGISLPVVYNSSGFERVEILKTISGMVDVYLVDLRYSRAESAKEGSDAPGYVKAARSAFQEMWEQAGPLKIDESGAALSGVICRLLVLPGLEDEVIENLEWIAQEIGTGVTIGVMAQYTPTYKADEAEGWNRRVTRSEYGKVCDAVERLGFTSGWVQEYGDGMSQELIGHRMMKNMRGEGKG